MWICRPSTRQLDLGARPLRRIPAGIGVGTLFYVLMALLIAYVLDSVEFDLIDFLSSKVMFRVNL